MVNATVVDTKVFERISPDTVSNYLESAEGWELAQTLGGVDTWLNSSHKNHWGDVASFDISHGGRWGWDCYKGIRWLAASEGKTVLDYLVLFGAVRISELFTIVDPAIDDVFKDLMKPQGTHTEGFEALRKIFNEKV